MEKLFKEFSKKLYLTRFKNTLRERECTAIDTSFISLLNIGSNHSSSSICTSTKIKEHLNTPKTYNRIFFTGHENFIQKETL